MSLMSDRYSDAGWSILTDGRVVERVERGALVYTPHHTADSVFVLKSGTISLFLRSNEGRVLTLRMIEAGQFFGHVAMSDGSCYDTYAQAVNQASYVCIHRDELPPLLERAPELGVALLDDVARHRAVVSRRLDEVAFKSVPARLASLLLDLAQRHGGPHAANVPRHSHRQLAEMINAYRETVTKVINQFHDARLLTIDRSGITLVNVRRLKELAQS
ncbi:MAG: Crp/Fnr family transcriptional regulator [Chloroflexi bacterium]|nr:Crp/Fnr family transcriptional regulator [Chloroflexota bacterium]